jgi:transposase
VANRRKDERNAEIVKLYDSGKGLLQREIAEKFGMGESAVSMVISRDKKNKNGKETDKCE